VREKVRDVVVMGGAERSEGGSLVPDASFNNTCDLESAKNLYERLDKLGTPILFLTRHAASAAQIDMGCYDGLAKTGGAAGERLVAYQRHALQHLYDRTKLGADDPRREGLPARCDRAWFLKTFTSAPADFPGDDFWPLLKGLNPYDALATLAAIPGLSGKLFDATELSDNPNHRVIGVSADEHGISDSDEVRLALSALAKASLSESRSAIATNRSASSAEARSIAEND
jgi:hypothetical protein